MAGLLQSPLHKVLSKSTDLVRYKGRRSGREFITPTQYVKRGEDVIILVGRPEAKTWWRNFTTEHGVDVLVARQWLPMTALAIVGSESPDAVKPLLDAYLERFPKAARMLGVDGQNSEAPQVVVVLCRPR